MYAIIRTGGKQYRVEPGDTLRVEKLEQNLGDEIQLTEVLAVGGDKTFLGEPTVKDAAVTAVVVRQSRAPKILIFKKKRRQGYRKMQGHRQFFTELFIKTISGPEGEAKADKEAVVSDPAKKAKEVAKTREAKKAIRKDKSSEPKKAAKKKTAKKKTAKKKTATKKKAAKKKAAKKKTAKKKTAKKATAKKATAKKATKKKTTKK